MQIKNENPITENIEKAQEIEDKKHQQEEIKKSHSRHHPVKEKAVKLLAEKIKNAKTLMIVSIKGLPSKQFQMIKKSIREHASVQVAKKNMMIRAIDAIGKNSILDLKKYIQENSAFVISDMEGYELAGILIQKRNPINAKAGQIAPEDIEIKAGPTELVPGPAISELGSVGLKISVENDKLTIKNSKVIVKKDEKISEVVASILQKLKIQPFSVCLEPVAIFDIEHEKIYTDINIDPEKTTEELREAAGKALGFAQKIVYYCKETIGYLLAKANSQGEHLSKLQPKEVEEKVEEQKTEKTEEKPIESTDNSNENQAKQTEPSEKSDTNKIKPTEDTQIKSEEEK
jgi:large subunit ribosomal protein L10